MMTPAKRLPTLRWKTRESPGIIKRLTTAAMTPAQTPPMKFRVRRVPMKPAVSKWKIESLESFQP